MFEVGLHCFVGLGALSGCLIGWICVNCVSLRLRDLLDGVHIGYFWCLGAS